MSPTGRCTGTTQTAGGVAPATGASTQWANPAWTRSSTPTDSSPGRIAWFVDNIGYYELGDQAPRQWASRGVNAVAGSVEYPKPFDEQNPMYLILNVAVGGKWPGTPPAGTRFPTAMAVDWVKVYEPG